MLDRHCKLMNIQIAFTDTTIGRTVEAVKPDSQRAQARQPLPAHDAWTRSSHTCKASKLPHATGGEVRGAQCVIRDSVDRTAAYNEACFILKQIGEEEVEEWKLHFTSNELQDVELIAAPVDEDDWDAWQARLAAMKPRRLRRGCCSPTGGHDLYPLASLRLDGRSIVACYASMDTKASVIGIYGYVEGEGGVNERWSTEGCVHGEEQLEDMIRRWCLIKSAVFRLELLRQRVNMQR